MTTYYKFLQKDNTGKYSNFDYSEYLPKVTSKGKWLPKIEDIVMCESGYHACEKKDLLGWVDDALYIVEFRGDKKDGDDKIVAQQMRFVKRVKGWNEKNLRLAAADIVERISLPVWKEYYPDDSVLEFVLEVVRRYANGRATDDELSAAESAAWSAAESAAWSAARSAARSAAESAAWSAARSATWSAAESAALSAARSAAESAARSAAESAAWSAAWSAAESAAWSAARSAARSAAESAALDVIYKRCGIK